MPDLCGLTPAELFACAKKFGLYVEDGETVEVLRARVAAHSAP